jgi:selenoprotein W-related protein
VSAVADLLRDYQHVISELKITTGSGGTFDVRVDGELIFSKKATGRHAEAGEVLHLFREHIGPDTPVYDR